MLAGKDERNGCWDGVYPSSTDTVLLLEGNDDDVVSCVIDTGALIAAPQIKRLRAVAGSCPLEKTSLRAAVEKQEATDAGGVRSRILIRFSRK